MGGAVAEIGLDLFEATREKHCHDDDDVVDGRCSSEDGSNEGE